MTLKDKAFDRAVGKRIKELRLEAGATLDQLSRACHRRGVDGYNSNRLGAIEKGSFAPTVTAEKVIDSEPTRSPAWGSADDLAVSALDITPERLQEMSEIIWGSGATVTTVRDHRSGLNATPQKRGRVTRNIIAELRAEIDRLSETGSVRTAC